jgi:2-octaprenyl-6-methoxyphenol hydroxylase
VCKVSHEHHHQNIAIERFFPAGPFAILPLADGYSSSVVWVEKKELAELYLNMPTEELLHYLTERFSDYLGNLKIVGEIFNYQLLCSYAKKFYGSRLALIADAAHSIHPIAGQGLNLGIADIDCLVQNISSYASVGLDIGSTILLKKYHRQRFLPVMAMLVTTDGLNKLFSNENFFLSAARRIGMAGIDKISVVKKKIMQHAMGL